MRKILFNTGYAIIYLFSLIPFWLMYIISDVLAFFLAKVIRYRNNVIKDNIQKAFPNLSQKEINKITKDFYRRFCDNFLETLKLISISEKELNKRFTTDVSLLHQLRTETDKNVTIALGHFFNWEMGNLALALNNPFQQLIIYKKVNSNFFEQIMVKLRARFNAKIIASAEFSSNIRKYNSERYTLVLVADQNPYGDSVKKAYWTNFLGHIVPFVKGPEKTAVINDNAVVFGKMYRVKRGYYRNRLELVTADAKNTARGEITKKIVRLLEENMEEDIANYLWSHRRFRHTYKEEYKRNLLK